MKLVYAIIILATVLCAAVCIFSVKENFKGVHRSADYTGVPNGEPRTRKMLVDMGDHQTVVTVNHGKSEEFVILIHGYPLNQDTWTPLVEELMVRARAGDNVPTIITYDLRGCGYAVDVPIADRYLDADPNNKEWTLELFANDLYRIYKEIIGTNSSDGVRKVGIGGWGFGGCVAQQFALSYPNLISNLYLFSTLGVGMTTLIPDIKTHVEYIKKYNNVDGMLALPTAHVQELMCDWFNVEDTHLCPHTKDTENDVDTLSYAMAKAILTTANVKAHLQSLKIMVNLDLLSKWHNSKPISYPVSFVAATRDTAAPPNQLIKIFNAIKAKNTGDLIKFYTPTGKHYYCLQHPNLPLRIICNDCDVPTKHIAA